MESRKIVIGYQGWATKYPNLTEFAKKVLKTKGPVAFANIFGTYFVVGQNNGAQLNVELTMLCQDDSSKDVMAAELTAYYHDECQDKSESKSSPSDKEDKKAKEK
jgi:hypothetical protein